MLEPIPCRVKEKHHQTKGNGHRTQPNGRAQGHLGLLAGGLGKSNSTKEASGWASHGQPQITGAAETHLCQALWLDTTKCVEVDVPFPVIPELEGNRVARELQGERQDSEEPRVHPTVLGGRNQKYQ